MFIALVTAMGDGGDCDGCDDGVGGGVRGAGGGDGCGIGGGDDGGVGGDGDDGGDGSDGGDFDEQTLLPLSRLSPSKELEDLNLL